MPNEVSGKIEKKLELRTTIVGKKCFTIAIDAQEHALGKIDWRKSSHETIDWWFRYDLPKEIEEKLLTYNEHFHLNYAAADIIINPDDEYIFLESNPAGEFNWADNIYDGEIADEIAELLLGNRPRLSDNPYSSFE